MGDLPMFDSLTIKSKINGSYTVNFISDLIGNLRKDIESANCIFVIDENILKLFSTQLSLVSDNGNYVAIVANETNKTMDYAQQVIRKLIALDVRKNNVLVAIGGGITQDIVAFISSILFRGVEWKFYPTTLLAQCDSCIGSKSSINFDQYKNLVGTFNPPSQIFIYSEFLNTLTDLEIKSGIGEMLHYFFSEGIELAQQISNEYVDLLIHPEMLLKFINNSLRIKKNIIEIDEFDTSIRHIFNYGHTFGHAIEAITEYKICHGQAVSIGMDVANYISLKLNMINESQFNQMHAILIKNIPEFKFTSDMIDSYIAALSKDKKNKGNKLGCILTQGPGKLEKFFLNMDTTLKDTFLSYSNDIKN
jgi:3-dehydroquinate synthase